MKVFHPAFICFITFVLLCEFPDYLNGIMESIMYLLISPDIYGCSPIGVLAQDLVVQYVLMPVLNLISDSDFVNQYVVWLVSSLSVYFSSYNNNVLQILTEVKFSLLSGM